MSKTYKAHLEKLIEVVKKEMFLHEYSHSVVFDYCHMPENVMAKIEVDPTYLNFTICFSPEVRKYFKNGLSWELAEIVVHELCHVLTKPLFLLCENFWSADTRKYFDQVDERQTQRMAIIILNKLSPTVYKI